VMQIKIAQANSKDPRYCILANTFIELEICI